NLVDVLPSRSGRTHETFFEVRLIDRDLICDSEHVPFSVATHSSVFALVAFTTGGRSRFGRIQRRADFAEPEPGHRRELPSHRTTEPPARFSAAIPGASSRCSL